MNNKLHLFIAIILSIILVGCGPKQEKPLPPPPIKVTVAVVNEGDLNQSLDVTGNLQFMANTTVASEISARVLTIEVRDGQPVKKGQVLLTFDDSLIKAAVVQAQGTLERDQALLAYNKSELDKNIPLKESGAISQSVYDQKVSAYQNSLGQVEADKGALDKAKQDLKNTTVLSPITGLLSTRYVEIGDWASTGSRLFRISDYNTMYLQVYMTDKEIGHLDVRQIIQEGKGLETDIQVDSYPGQIFKGTIKYIQSVNETNRLFEVRIYISNPDMKLMQGMFGRTKLTYNTIKDVKLVSVQALLDRVRPNDDNTVVRVNKEEKAEQIRIKVGAINDTYAEVLEGLSVGDRIVIEGKEVVMAGQPLKVVSKDVLQ